jgi:hypothetical protein
MSPRFHRRLTAFVFLAVLAWRRPFNPRLGKQPVPFIARDLGDERDFFGAA